MARVYGLNNTLMNNIFTIVIYVEIRIINIIIIISIIIINNNKVNKVSKNVWYYK